MKNKPIALIIMLFVLLAASLVRAEEASVLTCVGAEDCGFTLDEKALKDNISLRISASMKAQNLQGAYPLENSTITGSVPFMVGDLKLVAVRVELKPVKAGDKTITNYLIVDPGGRMTINGIQLLENGDDVIFPVLARLKRVELPADFGQTVIKGKGQAEAIMVTEVFCPYCREAFRYFIGNLDLIKDVKIVHLVLGSHPGADVAAWVMVYAEKHNLSPEAVLRFAFTNLKQPKPSPGGTVNVPQFRKQVLEQFYVPFPDLKKALGEDLDAALKTLEAEAGPTVDADKAKCDKLGLDFTPVLFINGIRIDGFNQGEIKSALKLSNTP